jgi:SAM-dependent methyltransferase
MRQILRYLRRRFVPVWVDAWQGILKNSEECVTAQFGSGIATKLPNAINVDINMVTKPDVICDLNAKSFPFKTNSFEMVVAISILEHLDDFFSVMGEIHRISKPGASVHILVPHFSSAGAFVDPTHCQFISARTCDYFIDGTDIEREYGFYIPYRFRLKKRHVELSGIWNYIPLLRWLAEKHTAFWEEHLCYIFRGSGVYWELEVDK